MAAGEQSIEQTFGQSWDILAPDLRDAYKHELQAQHARVMLGVGAVLGALETEVTPAHYQKLQETLAGKHLKAVTQIADTVESLAEQVGIFPYASEESEQELGSLLSLVPEVTAAEVPAVEVPTPLPVEPRPEPEHEPEPVELPPAAEQTVEEPQTTESEAEAQVELQPEPVTSEAPVVPEIYRSPSETLIRKRRILISLFGQDSKREVESLAEADADQLFDETIAKYLSGLDDEKQTEREARYIEEVREYASGTSNEAIAKESGRTKAAVQVGRSALLKRVRESLASSPEQKETEHTEADAKENSVELTDEQLLKNQVDTMSDWLYFDKSQRRDVTRRLDETQEHAPLSTPAQEALTKMGAAYEEMMEQGVLTLSGVEIGVVEKIMGTEPGRSMTEPRVVAGIMREEVAASGLSLTQIITNVLTKMNQAHDHTSNS